MKEVKDSSPSIKAQVKQDIETLANSLTAQILDQVSPELQTHIAVLGYGYKRQQAEIEALQAKLEAQETLNAELQKQLEQADLNGLETPIGAPGIR